MCRGVQLKAACEHGHCLWGCSKSKVSHLVCLCSLPQDCVCGGRAGRVPLPRCAAAACCLRLVLLLCPNCRCPAMLLTSTCDATRILVAAALLAQDLTISACRLLLRQSLTTAARRPALTTAAPAAWGGVPCVTAWWAATCPTTPRTV